jgi:hypothetical protein
VAQEELDLLEVSTRSAESLAQVLLISWGQVDRRVRFAACRENPHGLTGRLVPHGVVRSRGRIGNLEPIRTGRILSE